MKDKEGHEYLDQIRKYVSEHGYLTRNRSRHTTYRYPAWQETDKKAKDVLAVTPEYLPNTYLKYYLYPDYVFEHMKDQLLSLPVPMK